MKLNRYMSLSEKDREEAINTPIEDIAETLAKLIIMPTENWELILLSVLSPYAPNIKISEVEQRGNIHVNMVGEISTAKSSVMKILRKTAPKSTIVTKTTQASIEGTVTPGSVIVSGIIEQATDGILIVPEFKKVFSKYQIMREAMDNDTITISKRNVTWSFNPNTSFIVGSNPKNDFFSESGKMRNEIPFDEGILSRFDVIFPLIIDVDEMPDIVENIKLIDTDKKVDFNKIKNVLTTYSILMSVVKQINITTKQEKQIKAAYLAQNKKMGDRPKVILRDIETLMRFVNVIAAIHSHERKIVELGVYQADNSDVEKAIDLWNYLIMIREQLYEIKQDKIIKTPEDIIYDTIKSEREIEMTELRDRITSHMNICCEKTLYNKIKKLNREGKIHIIGKKRNLKISIN